MSEPALRLALAIAGVLLLVALAALALFSDVLGDAARLAADLQMQLNRDLARELRGVRDAGLTAVWGLAVIGFTYGVLHTLGPGHGKAVVVAYFLDPGRRMGWLDGILAGAWIAITHTVSAIVMVGVLYLVTRPTPLRAIGDVRSIELVSYALITVIGLFRLWAGITGRLHEHHHHHGHAHGHDRAGADGPAHGGRAGHHGHDHAHGHDHDHGHAHRPGHDHGHAPAHGHASVTGIRAEAGSAWHRIHRFLALDSGLGLLTAAGIAPCAGAVVLMLLASALGVIWAGIAGVLAIALGMAITLAGVGIASMLAHRLLLGERQSNFIGRLVTIGAALVVVGTGGFMLAGALYRLYSP